MKRTITKWPRVERDLVEHYAFIAQDKIQPAERLLVVAEESFDLAQMMMLEDRYFSGKYDKLMWTAAFIVVSPAAPFAFLFWKHARTAERAAKSKAAERGA